MTSTPSSLQVIFLAFLASGVAFLVIYLIGNRLTRVAENRGWSTNQRELLRLRGPAACSVASGIIRFALPHAALSPESTQLLVRISTLILGVCVLTLAYRLVTYLKSVLMVYVLQSEGKLDDQLVPLLSRASKVGVVVLGTLLILQSLGVDVSGLMAGLGIGGLALALAAKDTLENLFGSIMIFVDRPFQIGDWVIVAGEVEGVVEEVGLRTTRIRTFANSLVAVPNAKMASAVINNMGSRVRRRITTTIGVTYSTPRASLDKYVSELETIVRQRDDTFKGTVEIHFSGFGSSALEILVYFFVEVPDWHAELRARHEIYLQFLEAAERLGVQMAFPSTSLYVERWPPMGDTIGPARNTTSP